MYTEEKIVLGQRMNSEDAVEILKFWFGEDYQSWPDKTISKNWFMGGVDFDTAIADNFLGLIETLLTEELEYPTTSERLLASILLLDQFTRNIFRGTAKAFSGDDKALELAKFALKQNYYKSIPAHQKIFLTMPYEHSENIAEQLTCLQLFEDMLKQSQPPLTEKIKGFYGYAEDHYEIIKEFGRYPHRNAILGRTSTEKEVEYIANGKSFGQ